MYKKIIVLLLCVCGHLGAMEQKPANPTPQKVRALLSEDADLRAGISFDGDDLVVLRHKIGEVLKRENLKRLVSQDDLQEPSALSEFPCKKNRLKMSGGNELCKDLFQVKSILKRTGNSGNSGDLTKKKCGTKKVVCFGKDTIHFVTPHKDEQRKDS